MLDEKFNFEDALISELFGDYKSIYGISNILIEWLKPYLNWKNIRDDIESCFDDRIGECDYIYGCKIDDIWYGFDETKLTKAIEEKYPEYINKQISEESDLAGFIHIALADSERNAYSIAYNKMFYDHIELALDTILPFIIIKTPETDSSVTKLEVSINYKIYVTFIQMLIDNPKVYYENAEEELLTSRMDDYESSDDIIRNLAKFETIKSIVEYAKEIICSEAHDFIDEDKFKNVDEVYADNENTYAILIERLYEEGHIKSYNVDDKIIFNKSFDELISDD